MTEDEVSKLLDEHVEALSNHHSVDGSISKPAVHPQQTVQVVIHRRSSCNDRLSTPSTEQTRGRISKKKRGGGTAAGFIVHEDRPNTTPLVKASVL